LRVSSPINRLVFGLFLPVILEGLIYQSYLFLNPRSEPNFLFFLILAPIMIPLFFLYMATPYIIYIITGVGGNYRKGLLKNIDSIFLQEKDVLTDAEEESVREELRLSLIPELARQFRRRYVDSYFQERLSTRTRQNNLLGFYEALFLFGSITGFLNVINALLTLYVTQTDLVFEFNIKLDKIDNIWNAVIFFFLFGLISFSAFFLAFIAKRRIALILPEVITGYVDPISSDASLGKRLLVRAFSSYDFESLVGADTLKETTFLVEVFSRLQFYDLVSEIVEEDSRISAGRELVWESYSRILKNKGISNNKIETLESSFLEMPMLKSAEVFSFDYREFKSLKADLSYTFQQISLWNEKTNEERLAAFMLLYRASETLFRGVLRKRRGKMGNFGSMVLALAEMGLINNEEQIVLNQARRQRNYILHRSGEQITLSQGYMRNFYDTVTAIVQRAGASYVEKESEEETD